MNFCKRKTTFLFFILYGIIIITGCSSSSNTIRYGSNNDDKNEKKDHVRYGQNEKRDENIITTDNEENDPDETPDDLMSVDVSMLKGKFSSMENSSGRSNINTTLKETMLMEIIKYMNTPYKFGGNSIDGIDCSAFTQTVYNSCSLKIPRSAKEQFTQGTIVEKKDDLKFGDLVFFNTRKNVKPGHVGIYIGDNLFVHASKKGVIVTPLSHDYYDKRYMGGRRIDDSLAFQ